MPKTHFECVLCGEDKFEAYPRWVGDSRVCDECAEDHVAPRFHDALQHEHHYPPTWGKEVMDIWTFWDMFDNDFIDAWRTKLREYAVPVRSRLYCAHRSDVGGDVCGAYLGIKGVGSVACSLCPGFNCRRCGVASGTISSASDHCCPGEASKEDPFEKLSKGRDYQQCPGCKKEIFQAEGCNHMVCVPPCNTNFCFVCGKQVGAHRSGHWQKGGCPRFGVAGKRLFWDNLGEHSVADSEELEANDEDLAQHAADMASVRHLIEIFDHASAAELFDMTRTRYTTAPSPIHAVESSIRRDNRVRFFGYLSTNLGIVLQVMQATLDMDDVANLLNEFTNRNRRINVEIQMYKAETQPDVGLATTLWDLSEEIDTYFAFALETIEDLGHLVMAQENSG